MEKIFHLLLQRLLIKMEILLHDADNEIHFKISGEDLLPVLTMEAKQAMNLLKAINTRL